MAKAPKVWVVEIWHADGKAFRAYDCDTDKHEAEAWARHIRPGLIGGKSVRVVPYARVEPSRKGSKR